jgi:hypothetical protein
MTTKKDYQSLIMGLNYLEKNTKGSFTIKGITFSDAMHLKDSLSNYNVEYSKGKDMNEGRIIKISKLEENI